jgi:acyl-CoA reductase-like NAD-dependent aldehyde dehydrogenase
MAATETGVETYRNFIGGEWVDPAEGQTEEVINPATGEAIAQAPLSTAADVDRPWRPRARRSTAGRTRPPASARWRC